MGPHPEVFSFLVLHMRKCKVYLELMFYMDEKHWLFGSVKHTKIIHFLILSQTGNYWEEFFLFFLLHIFLKGFFC